MSLFGNLNKPAASSTASPFGGSLFGATAAANNNNNNNNNNATAQAGSLFGNTAQQGMSSTTPAGSILGGGGGAPQSSSSIFGSSLWDNNNNNNKQSTMGMGTNPFGASAASNFATSTATTATTTAAATRPTPAYFDSLLAKSKKRTDGATGDEDAAGGAVGSAADLPSLHLGLGDLRQKLRKLGPGGGDSGAGGMDGTSSFLRASAVPRADGKAHYVLAASGVDPGAAVRDLNNFSIFSGARGAAAAAAAAAGTGAGAGAGAASASTIGAGAASSLAATAIPEVDVDTYLANLQTKTTLSMIADGLDQSVRDFDSFLEDNVTTEWEAQRKRIYEHFGIKTRDDLSSGGGGLGSRYGTPDPTAGGGGPGGGAGGGGGGAGAGGFGRRRSRQQASQMQGGAGKTTTTTTGAGQSVFGRSRMQKSVIGSASRIGQHASEFADVPTAGGSSSSSTRATGAAAAAAAADDGFMRQKQDQLAEVVRALNDSRMQAVPFPILGTLATVEAGLSGGGGIGGGGIGGNSSGGGPGSASALLVDALDALATVVGEDAEAVGMPAEERTRGSAGPKQRAFARDYLDPNSQSVGAVAMRRRILAGANAFLERKFFAEEVEAQIARFPQEASLGGRPDVVSKIKAYIRVRAAQKMLVPDNVELQQVQGEFVWAVIFYLLRSGHVTEAAQYVNEHQTQIRGIDRVFASYMNSYASSEDRRLKRAMQERCSSEYLQRARNAPEGSVDPFRMACYKVIGRCDVANRHLENLQTDVHDWVWLQFNLAREGDRAAELASEMYGLAELQETIREIGRKHFPRGGGGGGEPSTDGGASGSVGGGGGGGGGGPGASAAATGAYAMFFYLQVLAGLYEPAVAYLYAFSYVDAVHVAIALDYYGLLRTAGAGQAAANERLLSHNTRGQPQINFARMLGYYTRDFRAAHAAAAVDYLVLICMGEEEEGGESKGGESPATALCYEALRELVLETREFSRLIGDIRPDGTRIRGLIEERGALIALDREQDFVRAITLQAARHADDGGRTTDAVLLYHLAGDYDTVVVLVSRALSEAIALEIGEEPMRLVPVKPRGSPQNADTPPSSSLSLAAIDDPVELARTMMAMYERDHMFRRRIREENRIACSVLLQMSTIKGLVEAQKWPQCLDLIRSLEILPLQAGGDPAIVRSYAARFASLAPPVAINVPNLLMWTILCCTQQRARLLGGHFSGNESASRMLADELKQICIDLTAYTSQLRYRFPPYLHEALARASAD